MILDTHYQAAPSLQENNKDKDKELYQGTIKRYIKVAQGVMTEQKKFNHKSTYINHNIKWTI